MIAYFSGSGNSKFVAEKIAGETKEDCISINKILKEKRTEALVSQKPYVFVLPVYAGRIPRVVTNYLEKVEIQGNKQVYFIVTCFETPYASEKYIRKLCKKKQLEIAGFEYICMPQSYLAMYDVPSREQAIQIYQKAMPDILCIAKDIKEGKKFDHRVSGGGVMSDIINPIFYATVVSAKGFHINDKCIGCGECVKVCPLNNITLTDQKVPKWGNTCAHCMACINGCPGQAIEYKNATMNKSRNYNIGALL